MWFSRKKAQEKQTQAVLTVLSGPPDMQRRSYRLNLEVTVLGRSKESAQLVFWDGQDSSISRAHCSITREADGSYTLTDNGSSNGTYLNRRRLSPNLPMVLSTEDEITLGDVKRRGAVLRFVLRG